MRLPLTRRRLRSAALQYFDADELESAEITRRHVRLADAEFALSSDGRHLRLIEVPDDEWLRARVQEIDGDEAVWEVVAFLKVRRLTSPDEIVRRARTGELYDESYFTKRGGGAPYIGYPYESSGRSGLPDQIASELVADHAPTRVLDMGAATGHLVKALEDRGVDAAGIDISDWAIENRVTPSVIKGSALALPWDDGHFDVVISQDFMEHMHPDDLPAVVAEQVRVTRPGGHLIHLIPFYDADEPFQLDAHLCQASREWWIGFFESCPGVEVVRGDADPDAPRVLDRHIELRRT